MWNKSRYDFRIIQGQTLLKDFQFLKYDDSGTTNVTDANGVTHKCSLYDLSGWKGAASVRDRLDVYQDSMKVTINTTTATVSVYMTDEQTAAIKEGQYIWDLVLENASGEQEKPVYGNFLLLLGACKKVGETS